jgi:hypothetical protein
MANIEFWLSKDNDRFRFPVNPPSLSVQTSYTHKDIKVLALGDISFPQGSDLARYSFSSFFPEAYSPVYCEYSDFPKPFACMDKIQGWMNSGAPVRLTITGTPINTLVTIRGFTCTPWHSGDNDIAYTLSLTEHRTPTVVRRIIESAPSSTQTIDPPKQSTGKVNVSKGTNLNVRKTASTKASIVGKLKRDAVVTILATTSSWHKIKSGNITGYVYATYITLDSSPTTLTATASIQEARPVETREKGALNA